MIVKAIAKVSRKQYKINFPRHKFIDKVHPAKSSILVNWSFKRKRYYKYTFKYLYCTKCKNWAFGCRSLVTCYGTDAQESARRAGMQLMGGSDE